MNKINYLIVGLALVLGSCTKEGPKGADGTNGVDGTDGSSGTAACVECHSGDETMMVTSKQYEHSSHLTGNMGSSAYFSPASMNGCVDCHTSQGFQAVVSTGEYDHPVVENQMPANCYTCHKIHETSTVEDWNQRQSGPVEFRIGHTAADMSKANTCVQCHQSKKTVEFDLGQTEDVTVNGYFGPHHSPQGNMITGSRGSGAYELVGSVAYEDGAHATMANCASCHMATGPNSGNIWDLGGHSNNVGTGSWDDESRVINADACTTCHGTGDYAITDNEGATHSVKYLRGKFQPEIDALGAKLLELGYVDESGKPQNVTISAKHAGALYNYRFLVEDQSVFFHNPKYANALAKNSLEALN
ncbi:MAG: hypothetical protein KAH32_08320 [Chlamydiia bacterium]|nr:hypothetical protein [Chlamydiia bacterium]